MWRKCINAISAKTIITRAVSVNVRTVKEACTSACTAVKAVRTQNRIIGQAWLVHIRMKERYKMRYRNSIWSCITKYDNGSSCSLHSNMDLCNKWIESIGATKYTRYIHYQDIPKLLKTGKNTAFFPNTIVNTLDNRIFDHATIYKNTKTKQCWLVCHTYCDCKEIRLKINKWCKQNDLKVTYLEKSWYYPDEATGIVITTR